MNNKIIDIISFGTVYLDLDFVNFPFEDGIYAHREAVGHEYKIEIGGSAFNFAKISASLGQKVLFVGQLGADAMSDLVENLVKQSTVETHFIKSENSQTNLAVHYVHENGDSIMTSAGSANQNFSYDALEKVLKENLPKTKYLYLGGSFKLKNLLHFYPQIIKEAKANNVKIVLDHGRVTNMVFENDKEIIKSIIKDVDIYLPSKDEFLDLWGFSSLYEGLEFFAKEIGNTLVVKDSHNGSHTQINDDKINVAPPNVKPINTIGAGDSFNAGFIKADNSETTTLNSQSENKSESIKNKMKYASATAGIKISTDLLPTDEHVQLQTTH